ncbi:Cysteine-rich secretory family protein [Candida albicans]|uniref:Cysteine-rich secretory family protein n=1 Tax=Candida albicans TaxID=5476 RepID=A0A8H6BV88_CANAX|nr:Cysteine-rich secretory family protein [Candida albicans]
MKFSQVATTAAIFAGLTTAEIAYVTQTRGVTVGETATVATTVTVGATVTGGDQGQDQVQQSAAPEAGDIQQSAVPEADDIQQSAVPEAEPTADADGGNGIAITEVFTTTIMGQEIVYSGVYYSYGEEHTYGDVQVQTLTIGGGGFPSDDQYPTTEVSAEASPSAVTTSSAVATPDAKVPDSTKDASQPAATTASGSSSDLTWDATVYEYAQKFADQYSCSGNLQHSGGKYGENLAVGYADGAAALQAWYEEAGKDGLSYSYGSSSVYNHFTQVVWKSTTKLGCAYKDCRAQNWGLYVVCSYDPAGNVMGTDPKTGKSYMAENVLRPQ